MHLHLNGQFRVFDDQSRDVTPQGIKERGLLALILLSPGQRRTRIWLQDRLWSDRDTAQGSGSLRQALSKVRKSLSNLGTRLHSDRSAICIDPPFPIEAAFDPDRGELLEDITIADPEFSDWLALIRAKHDATSLAPSGTTASRAVVPHGMATQIRRIDRSGTQRGAFILRSLSQRIATGLALLGNLDVIDLAADEGLVSEEPLIASVELECLDDSEIAFVLLRVVGHPNRRIIWSGRLSINPDQQLHYGQGDVTRTINRTLQAVTDAVISTAALSPMAAIQKAIRRIFECDRASLFKADDLLKSAMTSDLRAQSLAWQAVLRQTERHEHCEYDDDRLTEALDFIDQAIRLAPQNPVILALSSEFTLNTTGDIDKANFLARRAVQCGDENPYALDALGHTLILQNRTADADRIATKARHYAMGLPHSHDWDMMGCFSKIAIGDTASALDLALTCHRKMPFGRHVLRYLTVLSYLADQPKNAVHYAEKLRRLEPGFSVQTLLGTYLPMARPRDAELMGQFRLKLA
jgi:tetratricopeptide (TPR) repeat protein